MSKSNNLLTNYFKRKEAIDDVDETSKRTKSSNENDENEPLLIGQSNLDHFVGSATSISNGNDTISTITVSATTESSISPSLNERDPACGPTKAGKNLLCGPFQPKLDFPVVNNRRFRDEWYTTYEWLEYSIRLDRAFCFPCRLRNDVRFETAFTVSGFNIWKNGTIRFNNHQAAKSHKESFEIWKTTVQNIKNNTDVLKSLDQQYSKQALENRTYLKEIIRTVHFLARQNISFHVILYVLVRGHREKEESNNKGNFLELLRLRSVDNELIKKKKDELQFTDYKIQNELIELMNKHVLNQIARQVEKAKYFAVMIDETTDIAKHEQVSLVLRYTDERFNIHERFVGFKRTTSMTGEALFNLLLVWLKEMNLDVKNIVGQSYDGASAMRGEYKGVATRLKEVAPCGIYIYCNGHVLNLCLVDVSSSVQSVRNNFGIISSLYNLVESSAKRHYVFEEIQQEAGLKSLTIKRLIDTRWTCRWDCLKVVLNRYTQIVSALREMEGPEAFLLCNSIRSFDFVLHLFMMCEIYLITNILSKYLQTFQICVTQALAQVKTTVKSLKDLRNETEFERFYSNALQMCEENEIDPPKEARKRKVPGRLGGGDQTLDNLTIKDHYRINTYYVVLDSIITSIESRFDENMISDVLLMEKLFLTKEFLHENELKQLSKQYSLSFDDLKGEQRLYKTKMIDQQVTMHEATTFIVDSHLNVALPVMNQLFKILWTLPANTCSCERSFSSLKRIKSYLRNTTGQDRLSGLALLSIEREFHIDYDEIIKEFVAAQDRRKIIF